MILEDYVLKLLIEHNCRLLENDGGKHHHHFHSSMCQSDSRKTERLLGRQPKFNKFPCPFSFFLVTFKFVF